MTANRIGGALLVGQRVSLLRSAFVLCLLVSAAVTAPTPAAAASPYFAPEPPSTSGAAFSAVVTTQSATTFAGGNRIVRTNTVRYFRDAEGRTRTERSARASDGGAAGAAVIQSTTLSMAGAISSIHSEESRWAFRSAQD
jgi:hypothetical protein